MSDHFVYLYNLVYSQILSLDIHNVLETPSLQIEVKFFDGKAKYFLPLNVGIPTCKRLEH